MNEKHIRQFLPLLNSKVEHHQVRDGWIIASCPFAKTRHSHGVDKHPSFGVRIDNNGISRFHCFSCNSSGELLDIILLLKEEMKYDFEGLQIHKALQMLSVEGDDAEINQITFEEETKKSGVEIVPFSDDFVDSFMPVSKFKKGLDYLHGRGVSDETILDLDVRYDQITDRVVFPVRDWEGRVVGMHGRHVTGDYHNPYYVYREGHVCNPIVWYGEDKIDPNQPVVLVESVFDRIKVYPYYKNVICSLSAGVGRDKVKRIEVLNPLITIADSGKGGVAWLKALRKHLPEHDIITIDIDDYGVGDPGELTDDQVVSLLESEFLL